MTLQPRCEDVETAEGVAITVTGVAQVKKLSMDDLIQLPINSESVFLEAGLECNIIICLLLCFHTVKHPLGLSPNKHKSEHREFCLGAITLFYSC